MPYWLVMEIENLLGWEHILQIHNQLIKHNIATYYFDLNTTQIVIPPPFF